MLALTCLIDIHTPISTSRNFIVLLPSTVLLVSNALQSLAETAKPDQALMSRSVSVFLLVALSALFFLSSYRALSRKIAPSQNWKALAEFVRDSNACDPGCFAIGSFGLHEFYLDTGDNPGIRDLSLSTFLALSEEGALTGQSVQERLDQEVQASLQEPTLPVLGFHIASRVARDLAESRPDSVCLQPPQSDRNSTFIVMPKSMLTGAEDGFGLQPRDFS